MVKKRTKKKSVKKTVRKKSIKNKISLVLKNLFLFLILFIASFIFYNVSKEEFYIDLFLMLCMIFGFVSLAFLIVLLVLFFLKLSKK